MTEQTRRSHPRFPLFADVLVIPRDGAHERFWAATENISMGGMFLRATCALPVDTELMAKIVPPESPTVHATARVIHVKQGEGFGCCIVELAPRSGRRLARWLGRSGGLPPVAGTIESN
jgi:hypothetical protein